MSALSAKAALLEALELVSGGHMLGRGLLPCRFCGGPTRCLANTQGVSVCMPCLKTLEAVGEHTCPWQKPKGYRPGTKKSTEEMVFLRGGEANGRHIRRGVGLTSEKKKEIVTWKPPFVIQTFTCFYIYDPLEDVYQHYVP